MDPKAGYTITGLFVVILGAAVITITLWLSTAGHKAYHTYLVYMNEAVSGLTLRAPVKFNGVTVGYVESIRLNPKDMQQVRLVLQIEEDTPITQSTRATLRSQGITGVTYVGLKAEAAKSPLLKAKPGEPYPIIESVPSFIFQLDSALRQVTGNVAKLTQSVQRAFNDENRKNLEQSLYNIQKITKAWALNITAVDSIIKDAKNLFKNAAQISDGLPKTLAKLNRTFASVQRMGDKLSEAGDSVAALADRLSGETLPNADRLIKRLRRISVNIDTVSESLAQNPSVLIRGKLPDKPGPGEMR